MPTDRQRVPALTVFFFLRCHLVMLLWRHLCVAAVPSESLHGVLSVAMVFADALPMMHHCCLGASATAPNGAALNVQRNPGVFKRQLLAALTYITCHKSLSH